MAESSGGPNIQADRKLPRAILVLLEGLTWLGYFALAVLILGLCALACAAVLGSSLLGVLGLLFVTALLPLIAVAARATRRRRATTTLLYLEQATRLGLPLNLMLDAARRSEPNPLRAELRRLAELLRAGDSLAPSLARTIPGLSPRAIGLIELAENAPHDAGDVPQTLRRLVGENRRRVMLGLVGGDVAWWLYPVILTAVLSAVVAFVAIFVFPKYEQIFRDFAVRLPPLSTTVLQLVRGIGVPLVVLAMLIVLAVTATSLRHTFRLRPPALRRTPRLIDRLLDRLPWAGAIARDRSLADICRVLADAGGAGRPLEEALADLSHLRLPRTLHRRIDLWLEGLRRGRTPDDAARAASMPSLVVGAVSAARGAGRLDEAFDFLSRYYDTKFSRAMLLLRGAAVPACAIVFGALVLCVVLAMFLPLVRLIDAAMPYRGASLL